MAHADDEFAGQGGSYELDPKTGKRRLVERTVPPKQSNEGQAAVPEPAAAASAATDQSASAKPTKK